MSNFLWKSKEHSVFRLWYLLFKLGIAKSHATGSGVLSIGKIKEFVERHSK